MGQFTTRTFSIQQGLDMYMVVYCDFPQRLEPDVDVKNKGKKRLEAMGMLDIVLKKENRQRRQGFPAYSYEFSGRLLGRLLCGRSLFVYHENRYYEVTHTGPSLKSLDSDKSKRFFHSFKMTD